MRKAEPKADCPERDPAPLVSIVIPARGDEEALPRLLAQLPRQVDVEVIVAIARPVERLTQQLMVNRPDVTWVESTLGRGPQLNAGAARATGTWLWFVHADSRLPGTWLDAFRALDELPDDIVGGSFRFCLDCLAWQARLLEVGVAWRVRWFNLPYGDQGLFVRRAIFGTIGGFAAIPLMEDVEFVGRLKRRGRLRHLSLQLPTSARRWEREGWWRRSARNLTLLTLYRFGASPQWLARQYYRKERS
jgi:rSAM/selenodomain-associated transferase 2